MDITRIWHESEQIPIEHSDLEVRQVYVWIISVDNMVAIVTKSDGSSQFPGGHPENGEEYITTAIREVNEEIGLDISSYASKLGMFGYYYIEEAGTRYVQLRYLLKLPDKASRHPLSVKEKSDEERPVESAKWGDLLNLPSYIPWTKNLDEYKNVMDLGMGK